MIAERSMLALGFVIIILFLLASMQISNDSNVIGQAIAETLFQKVSDFENNLESRLFCKDSDKGVHTTQKGQVNMNSWNGKRQYEDNCITEQELKEYSCTAKGIQEQVIFCEFGCKQGACQEQTTT